MRRVLFICTGNYYRSRFAEAVFNHHAHREGLPWRAFSRGLATHMAEGDLSPYTLEALSSRQIDRSHTGETRVPICEQDLAEADLRIALEENEHRPMVVRLFPHWEPEIIFWDVADIHLTAVDEALPAIEQRVMELVARLREEAPEQAAEEAADAVPASA